MKRHLHKLLAALPLALLILAHPISTLGAPTAKIEARGVVPQAKGLPWGENPLASLDGTKLKRGFAKRVDSAGTPFKDILSFTTAEHKGSPWGLQLVLPSQAPLKKDTVVYAEFYARTVSSRQESGSAFVHSVLELRRDPHTKSLSATGMASPDGNWVRIAQAGIIKADYAPGEASFNFQLGYDRDQVIEIADLRLVDLGPGIELRNLPLSKSTYVGREANAPWRTEAQARIEKLRKGDLAITVLGANGKPVPNARVQVEMTRHAFPFGTAVVPDLLIDQSPDSDKYRQWVLENCSRVVIENHLKWPNWDSGLKPLDPTKPNDWRRTRETTLKSLAWLNEHGIEIKGHNLIWPSWKNSPKRVKDLKDDPAALRAACEDRIKDALGVTAPYRLVEWDVVNENFANHDITDILGPDAIVEWFKLARRHYPEGKLIYNDYAHLTSSGITPFKTYVEDLVLRLKAAGAPVDGLGIQAHFGGILNSPTNVIAELDRLHAKLGVELSLTEFDVNTYDEEVQADYTRDILTAAFASPHVTSFLMWGFWEKAHWIKNAALFRADWTPKPNAKAWSDLVKGAWWTRATLTTDSAGRAALRGFKGDYTITVKADGSSHTRKISLGSAAEKLEIKLTP
jgi:endo-1,4-beta-xylanase